jgi:hypothetical protein
MCGAKSMSALPPKSRHMQCTSHVCFGPIADIALHSITSSAGAAFRKMQRLEKKCTCEEPDWDGEYWKQEDCPACTQWWEQHSILTCELSFKPWQWPAYERPEDAGSPSNDNADRWRVIGCSSRQRKHNQTKTGRSLQQKIRRG